ncbi:MAG: hypothetical protein P8X63_02980 [Desulfuromonadaceae bacterium]
MARPSGWSSHNTKETTWDEMSCCDFLVPGENKTRAHQPKNLRQHAPMAAAVISIAPKPEVDRNRTNSVLKITTAKKSIITPYLNRLNSYCIERAKPLFTLFKTLFFNFFASPGTTTPIDFPKKEREPARDKREFGDIRINNCHLTAFEQIGSNLKKQPCSAISPRR